MKRISYLVNGFAAFACILLFAQCSGNNGSSATTGNPDGTTATTNMKIAFVEIDTLMVQYTFWNDLNEMMLKREENIRATLTQKGRDLEKDMQEFQRKIETSAFSSRERAEQEHARILKKQQDIQDLQTRLTNELTAENMKNSLQLRDSINSFLKEYNKEKGYSMIISNTGFDNLLYADSAFNITKEIVKGLNARYSSAPKK